MFVNEKGFQSTTSHTNDLFLKVLCEIWESNPGLLVDLHEKYNVFRSLRRGSESQAVAMKVIEPDRYVINRRKEKEALCGHLAIVTVAFLRDTWNT
jgi:hypothetical protein